MPSSLVDLEDRHIVVTGAAGGLGGAVVEALVAAGATCHLPQRRSAQAGAEAKRRVLGGVDLTDETAVATFYKGLPSLWASVHLAGGFAASPIEQTGLADLRKQIDLNFVTSFLCCREAVRQMRARAGGAGGRIVNVSSRAALAPAGGALAYTASKAALSAFTIGLAEEVKDDGILVAAVAPSTMDTPANRSAMPDADHSRWVRPEDLAQVIAWLVAPANRLVSGTVIPVFGRA